MDTSNHRDWVRSKAEPGQIPTGVKSSRVTWVLIDGGYEAQWSPCFILSEWKYVQIKMFWLWLPNEDFLFLCVIGLLNDFLSVL